MWTKGRSAVSSHRVWDVLRGATKALFTNTTNADFTESGLTSFDTGGFTVGSDGGINTNAATYVGWQWLAGASAANTDGTISSTVSANPTAGFSVVTYTGNGANSTVGHGLGVLPGLIIVKGRTVSDSWRIWHIDFQGTGKYLNMSSAQFDTNSVVFNTGTGTSTTFTIGTNASLNTNGGTVVAYCWAETAGFSKFSEYTGNGSTDGPFIYLGFKPAFILCKRIDSTGDWFLMDTARSTYNPTTGFSLYPNLSNTEGSDMTFDLVSNGFKVRQTSAWLNASGGTYIYAAFAEVPSFGPTPAKAR